MQDNVSECLDPFEKGFETTSRIADRRVDLAWCSDLCKQKVRDHILKRYPCRQRFTKIDVTPLYASDPQRYYRVSLWVNNWAEETLGPVPELWKTFYVTLEGIERTVVSIKESRRKRLVLGENGHKLMGELGIESI